MNTLQRIALLCLALSAVIMGVWGYQGAKNGFKLATPEQVMVEKVSVDEFGDEVVTKTLVDNPNPFDIGLDRAGPLAAALSTLAVVLMLVDRKRQAS